MKRIGLSLLTALLAIVAIATPALAIGLPSSTPSVEAIYAYRNILETGDWLYIVYENTPYSVTPTDFTYPEAYIWRWMTNDEVTQIAQASGYAYNARGYGYNIIAFYLNAANVTAKGLVWGNPYKLTLSGTPSAFASPPKYTFDVSSSAYSMLTVTSEVKSAIAAQVLTLAAQLDINWGLSGSTSLLSDSETGIVLSLFGQSFFRGAIYGLQAMAPGAFPLIVTNVVTTARTWTDTYSQSLESASKGTALDAAFTAGEAFLDVGYNLFGLLIVIAMIVVLIGLNWSIAGGNLWRGLIETGAPLVIGARIGLIGLGEVGLIAALCWLYISAKLWRMI